ncbi:anthranilate synthase, component I [Tistlia consotensis]|uniref:Anthranilate synthase component 1 n=1 Tax=Tistlia consotensis USBA 355 TaxID=560819 RepID=A0A1Y6CKM3_9PROT|nr:anthranilate synthase component I [Tistlia consotensis]SMF69695.1 anthranilate synthase, component I [Tistlia consotensis USBA 355]SNS05510.1 anthranilate synthase, component I [Tistlia consotensis]
MEVTPDFPAFEAAYKAGRPQVVSTRLIADLETPVSAYLKLAEGRPYSCLFESVEGGTTIGRYSFITMKPDLIWRSKGGRAEINRKARHAPQAFEPLDGPPLEELRKLVRANALELPAGAPPMAANLIGYMGYDMVRHMERLPDENPDVLGVPDAIFVRPTVTCVFDRVEDLITVFTPVWPQDDVGPTAAYDRALERLAEVAQDFERALPYRRSWQDEIDALPEPVSNMTPEAYKAMVAKAKEYVYAGDIFQVVLAQRFSVPFRLPPFSLYRALRRLNPSPFLFYLDLEGFSLVGSSPEVLVRLRDGRVTIRPLAGTRPRGATPERDRALAEELLADPKECAEHLMLLDLGRNDVGRVSKIGSVEVTEKFVIERYSHVMHISSNVEGELDPKYDAIDALVAGFPAGTVSGAPKVRAMEIIEELEPDRRGPYGGAVGYFGAGGAMDTCLALRTALVKDETMYIQAGAGIVADSDPESEHQECRNKARALVRSAEEAVKVADRTGGRNR